MILTLLRISKVTALLLVTFLMMPVLLLALVLPGGKSVLSFRLFCRLMLLISGTKANIIGEITAQPPVLYVSNHTSYLDIPLLGFILPGRFIAKKEVGSWPLIGQIAKITGTIFVERTKNGTSSGLEKLNKKLKEENNFILFAEGTTSDGNKTLPFKSSFFSVTENSNHQNITIQPVSIIYRGANGKKFTNEDRASFAWIGDTALVPHLWNILGLRNIEAEVRISPPLTREEMADRKTAAATCQQIIDKDIADSIK